MNLQFPLIPDDYFYGSLKNGTRVSYRGGFGANKELSVATITGRGYKNDRPLYDLDDGHWCYADQVESIAS